MARKIFIGLFAIAVIVAAYFMMTRERFYSTHSRKALEYYQDGVDNIMKFYMSEGRRDMELASKEDPDFPLPRLFLLHTDMYSMKRTKEQATWYKRLAVPSPQWTDFERGLIRLSLEKPEPKDREKMAREIESFLQKYPTRMEAFFLLINKYREIEENPDKLIRFYETMHHQYPNNVQILNTMGYLYMAMGQSEKARVAFEKYVYVRPNEANPYDSFGDFYYNTGHFAKAEAYYRKALARKPDFISSKLHIVRALIHLGKVKAALEMLGEIEKSRDMNVSENSIAILRFFAYAFTQNTGEMEKLVDRLSRMHLVDSVKQRITIQYCFMLENLDCVKEILEKEKAASASGHSLDYTMNRANFLRITGHPKESAKLLKENVSDYILNSNFDIRFYVYYILIEDYTKLGEFASAGKLANNLPLGYQAYFLMRIADAAGKKGKALEYADSVVKTFKGADADFYVLKEARDYAEQGNRK